MAEITTFTETVVPLDIAMQFDIQRSWKPSSGNHFRLIEGKRGYAIFPNTAKLSSEDKAAIVLFLAMREVAEEIKND